MVDAVAARTANLLRNRYFVWWRLSVRFVEAASLVALGRDAHGLGVAAAVGCAMYDVALAAWLWYEPRPSLWWRLVLDAVDVALWSWAIGNSPDVAALIASPLALQAGLQLGWRGLVMPLAVGALSAAVSAVTGQRPSLAP